MEELPKNKIAGWCNGSTGDFGSLNLGPTPSPAAAHQSLCSGAPLRPNGARRDELERSPVPELLAIGTGRSE